METGKESFRHICAGLNLDQKGFYEKEIQNVQRELEVLEELKDIIKANNKIKDLIKNEN